MKDIYSENKARKRRRDIQNLFTSGDTKTRFTKAYNYSLTAYKQSYNPVVKYRARTDMIFFKRRISRYK